jgi:hypothetical protein
VTLTAQQTTDVRRFCGYSVFGAAGTTQFSEPAYSDTTEGSLSLGYRLANLSPEEEGVVVNTYLTNLYLREQEIQGAAANLDTDKAAVWTHNKQEVSDRINLFTALRLELCGFLGFPPGSYLKPMNRVLRA